MSALAVVIGRAGSRGLPGKNVRLLDGRPLICHAVDAALAAAAVERVVVSTDGDEIAAAAESMAVEVIRRPPALCTDTAPVVAAVRHAVVTCRNRRPVIVVLYANVPLRPARLIDDAVELLAESGADSVQSYTGVGKHHPAWMVSMDGGRRVTPLSPNAIDRRQDLPPLLIPDGGVIAVTRRGLLAAPDHPPHAFLGSDRRGLETPPGAVIDVDTERDLALAEMLLARRRRDAGGQGPGPLSPLDRGQVRALSRR